MDRRLRQYHNDGDMTALPGAKVVTMVCAHMRGVFMEHRKGSRIINNVEYCRRSTETRPGDALDTIA